jgi:hypothetical protein
MKALDLGCGQEGIRVAFRFAYINDLTHPVYPCLETLYPYTDRHLIRMWIDILSLCGKYPAHQTMVINILLHCFDAFSRQGNNIIRKTRLRAAYLFRINLEILFFDKTNYYPVWFT